jgi:hypothetical protein
MTTSRFGPAHAVAVVGTVTGRGVALARRVLVAVTGAVIIGGLAAALMPWGLTLPWLAAVCGVVLVAGFVAGLRRDLRSAGQVRVVTVPVRGLVLRGTWTTREHDMTEVAGVQVWCDCGTSAPVAPHRDRMEVLLRDGRSVRITSGTTFPPDVAMTLGELLSPSGVKVVDWGIVGA